MTAKTMSEGVHVHADRDAATGQQAERVGDDVSDARQREYVGLRRAIIPVDRGWVHRVRRLGASRR